MKISLKHLKRIIKEEARQMNEVTQTASGDTVNDLVNAYKKKHGNRASMKKLEQMAVQMGWLDDDAIEAAEAAARQLDESVNSVGQLADTHEQLKRLVSKSVVKIDNIVKQVDDLIDRLAEDDHRALAGWHYMRETLGMILNDLEDAIE